MKNYHRLFQSTSAQIMSHSRLCAFIFIECFRAKFLLIVFRVKCFITYSNLNVIWERQTNFADRVFKTDELKTTNTNDKRNYESCVKIPRTNNSPVCHLSTYEKKSNTRSFLSTKKQRRRRRFTPKKNTSTLIYRKW